MQAPVHAGMLKGRIFSSLAPASEVPLLLNTPNGSHIESFSTKHPEVLDCLPAVRVPSMHWTASHRCAPHLASWPALPQETPLASQPHNFSSSSTNKTDCSAQHSLESSSAGTNQFIDASQPPPENACIRQLDRTFKHRRHTHTPSFTKSQCAG